MDYAYFKYLCQTTNFHVCLHIFKENSNCSQFDGGHQSIQLLCLLESFICTYTRGVLINFIESLFCSSPQEYSALTFKRRPWFLNWYKTNFILYPLRLHYGNLMLILVHSALPWAHKSFISAPPRDEAIRDIAKLCPA